MKRIIWKIRYARELRRLLKLPWMLCFETAGIALEELKYDLSENPKDAAYDEYDAWLQCL